MTAGIIHAPPRWLLGMFVPATGRRRAGTRPAVATPARTPEGPTPVVVRLPEPRSLYGLPMLLDGAATAPIRPYVLAAERAHQERERERARQTGRRAALVLVADFGIAAVRPSRGRGAVSTRSGAAADLRELSPECTLAREPGYRDVHGWCRQLRDISLAPGPPAGTPLRLRLPSPAGGGECTVNVGPSPESGRPA
ncbi:hypothetical protein ACWD25_21160 [Streptomyces sp. NPDC002920]